MYRYRAAVLCTLTAFVVILLQMLLLQNSSTAASGDPVAVRRWADDGVSVETQWGLVVAIDAAADAVGSRPADQVVRSGQAVNHVLSRLPNEPKPLWLPAAKASRIDPNSLAMESVQTAAGSLMVVTVDGVRIGKLSPAGAKANSAPVATPLKAVDVLLLISVSNKALAEPKLLAAVKKLQPRIVVLHPHATGTVAAGEKFRLAISGAKVIRTVKHNTLAISKLGKRTAPPQVVTLTATPWKMPADLAREFAGMEKASSDSQKVFAKLSVQQLNFKPANGTHTPRWNAEHMMGRQLLFFSQIYHHQQPVIPALDLNPKQMPKDYVFAHPGWNGVEEARQMERVSQFTRRFAYLLDGMPLNRKAPGSGWPTLQALLSQMQRHYGEHTANTVKKFSLPGFPAK